MTDKDLAKENLTERAIELPIPEHFRLRKQPKQKRTQALLDKVMVSTRVLAQEQGYLAVNTNAIAQHAGVDVKSLYEFFPNKEAIFYRIADQWLLSVRQLCVQFEDPYYQALSWREFFHQFYQSLYDDSAYVEHFNSLRALWELFPEFKELDRLHQAFMKDFMLRQLRHFGATARDEELTLLYLFMLAVEDGIGSFFGEITPEEFEGLWQLRFETVCFHLEKVLPD